MRKQKRQRILMAIGVACGMLWNARGLAQSSALQLSELRFAGTGAQRTLTLQFSHPPTKVQSFVLTSPTRLVIDVSGPVVNTSPGTIVVKDALIARVRTGSHDQRLRVVLDVQTKEVPTFSVAQQQGMVTATLTVPSEQASEPFSRLLFAAPGQAAPASTTPTVVVPPIVTRSTQEVKIPAPAKLPVAPLVVSPQKASPSEEKPGNEKLALPAPPVLPRTENTPKNEEQPKSEEKQDSVAKQVKNGDQPTAPAPAEPVRIVNKPSSHEPKPVKLDPREPEPGSQQPLITAKVQVPPQESKAVLPLTAQDHFERGQVLYATGKMDEAMVHWQETLRLAPETAKAYHLLGLALHRRGRAPEAMTALRETIRLTPRDATAYIHLGQILETKGDIEAARAAYQKAQQLVPTSAYVYDRLGHLSAAQEKWGETIYAWGETVRLRPQSAVAYANLGEALEKAGKKAEALASYERALQLDPRMALATKIRQRVTQLRTPTP